MRDSTVSNNLCRAGIGATGYAGGVAAGGGIGNDRGSIAIITNSTISLNECLGGSSGGVGVGAGIENGIYSFAYGVADASSLVMSSCQIIGNVVQGGNGSGAVGGDGLGGGIFVGSGTGVLQGVVATGNQAMGGVDSHGQPTGNGLGGGVYIDPTVTATADTETLIAGNQASKDKNDVWGTITIVP
jgi:hypothetical protein